MKNFLLALLLVLSLSVAPDAMAADNLYSRTDEAGTLFLTDGPCVHPAIVAITPADVLMMLNHWFILFTPEGAERAGQARVEGCYSIFDGYVFWVNQFGGNGITDFVGFVKLKVEHI